MTNNPEAKVEAMSAEELAHSLHIWVDEKNGPAFDEMCARLRERDEIIKQVNEFCEIQWKLHHNGLAPAIQGCMLAAMQSARSETGGEG